MLAEACMGEKRVRATLAFHLLRVSWERDRGQRKRVMIMLGKRRRPNPSRTTGQGVTSGPRILDTGLRRYDGLRGRFASFV